MIERQAPSPPVLRLDLNGDKAVDNRDLAIVLAALQAPPDQAAAMVALADVNGDAVVDLGDLRDLLRGMGGGLTIEAVLRQHPAGGSFPSPQAPPPPQTAPNQPPPNSNPLTPSSRSPGGPAGPGGNTTTGPGAFLRPGAGFSDLTAEPAQIGVGDGADATAIARWNVVPFDTFSGEFNVGVVAFHINGIDRVEFSANGGAWVPVREMRTNPQTGTAEYWVRIRASDFPDGQLEVRAVAYPTVGVPRVLQGDITPANARLGEHALFLYANSGGSLPANVVHVSPSGNDANDGTSARPFRTVFRGLAAAGEGGEVHLAPGLYRETANNPLAWGPNERWITVRAAPSLERDAVTIDFAGFNPNRSNALTRVRFQDLRLSCDQNSAFRQINAVWLDRATLFSPSGRDRDPWFTGYFLTTGTEKRYATDVLVTEWPYRYAFGGFDMVRNSRAVRFLQDGFIDCPFIINGELSENVSRQGLHPDGWQWGGSQQNWGDVNIIVYGLRMMGVQGQQIFSGRGIHNAAFVNVLGVQTRFGQYVSQFGKEGTADMSYRHLLFYNVTLPNSRLAFRFRQGVPVDYQNIRISGTVADQFWIPPGFGSEFLVDNSHANAGYTANSQPYLRGMNTHGNPLFVSGSIRDYNPAQTDYRPATNSPLQGRLQRFWAPVDAANRPLRLPAAIGALQGG